MMLRWNNKQQRAVQNDAVDAFIADLIKVFERHKMSISIEDGHAAFEIEPYSKENVRWLSKANDAT